MPQTRRVGIMESGEDNINPVNPIPAYWITCNRNTSSYVKKWDKIVTAIIEIIQGTNE